MTEHRTQLSFEAFEPLLWRVLGSLARRGFVAPPPDARDVIHDFYLEAWDGLKHRYDERITDFKTYLSSSFYKFARRRIVALQGWRRRLVDIELFVDDVVDENTPQRIVEQRQLLFAIRAALSKLPSDERVVLIDYLHDPQPSERTIAARHSLSRHALRERLLNAVGRVAVEMGRGDGKTTASLVAIYLWREGRSPRNVSELMGISIPDVQRCRSEFASQLLLALRGQLPSQPKPPKGVTMSPLDLLKTTLLAPGDKSLLERLKSSEGLRQTLLSSEEELDFSQEERRVLESHPEWVESVYATFAEGCDEADDQDALARSLAALRNDAEREIGEAFVNLLERLEGSEFSDWKHYFGALAPLSANDAAALESSPSFVEGVPRARLLASYGLTPLMFHDSVRGIELLFDRLLRSCRELAQPHTEAPFPNVFLCSGEHTLRVPGQLVASQLTTTPGMRPEAMRGMAHWLGDILQRVPLLVRGYETKWRQGHLQVDQLLDEDSRSSHVDDVVRRWTQVTSSA